MSELARKRARVIDRLGSLGSVLVAYSGGVDSALLLALARESLGARAVAFTAISPAVAPDELEGARALARQLGAEHVEKASGELLEQLARSEMALRALGLREFRVRYHGEVARIEVAEPELPRLLAVRAEAAQALREAGFKLVSLDLEPFRSGRLNEAAGLVPL